MTELPENLEEEILCRVPATSLQRLRSTCKRWYRLFNDARFAERHTDKSAKQSLVLMLTKNYMICPITVNLRGNPSLWFETDHIAAGPRSNNSSKFEVSRVFHCDGLLLCTPEDESRNVVWNPCNGETRWIKLGKGRKIGRDFALGYVVDSNKSRSSKKNYKILSFYRYCDESEIYEFSSDSWRVLDGGFQRGWSLGYSEIVSLKGKTYMFARDETETKLGESLLRFDFSTERSQRVPLPYQRDRSYETAVLSVVGEEKLSVLLQQEAASKTEIWVTDKIEESRAVSWSKVLALELGPDLRIPEHGSFLLDEEKKAVVVCQRWIDPEDETTSVDKVYILGERNKVTLENFGTDSLDGCWPAILNYVPSLVQIKRARRVGARRNRGDEVE